MTFAGLIALARPYAINTNRWITGNDRKSFLPPSRFPVLSIFFSISSSISPRMEKIFGSPASPKTSVFDNKIPLPRF